VYYCADRSHERIGHRDDHGQEPLEFHERAAPGPDGQRSSRYRVHSVSGRRADQLHGDRHSRRDCRGGPRHRHAVVRAGELQEVRRDDPVGHEHVTVRVRRDLRERQDERSARRRAGPRAVRFDYHRAGGVGVRDLRGGHVERARRVLGTFADEDHHRAQRDRRRAEPGDRVTRDGLPLRSQNARPAVHEHSVLRVQRVLERAQRMRDEGDRSQRLRSGGSGQTVDSVPEYS